MNEYRRVVLGGLLGSEILSDSIRDVKPAACGMVDESWYVFQTEDGRWHTYSDHADQLATHASEADATAYWEEAAAAYADE